MHPGVGAPLAAGFLEELIARGCRTFIACGGAGVLVPDVALGHVIVPTRGDPGRGHLLPLPAPSRDGRAHAPAVDAIVETLERHHVPYVTGKTWTTDGLYRETRGKVERRVAEGCLTVEMEAAAFFAVAAFRGVSFGQLLYAGDDLSGDAWDQPRMERPHDRSRDSCSAWRPRRAWSFPPDSASGVGYPPRMKP